MNLTENEKQAIIDEAYDPEKVNVYCATHFYFGPTKTNPQAAPSKNCSKCWYVYYLHDIATAPPHLRHQRLAELEEVVHKMVELVEKGEFDLKMERHPKIEIEKDAF